MVPALKEKKKKKSSKTMKHKKKRKSSVEKSPSLNGTDDSSDDILSPNKKLRSMSFYVNNRQEMIDQMFYTISEEKVRAMLPPILKDESMDDLRSNCLEALLGMSSKRIKCVIGGEDLGSQSSDTESDTAVESANEDSASSSSEDMPIKEEFRGSKKRGVPDKDEGTSLVKKSTTVESETDGRSLLEIVELQLRARAIRAALVHASETASPENKQEAGGNDDPDVIEIPNIPIKQERISPIRETIPPGDTGRPTEKKFGGTGSSNIFENTVSAPVRKKIDVSTIQQKDSDRVIVLKKNPTGGNTIVITKNSSGPSKKNIIVIGPKKKAKNKIVYSRQKVLHLDSPKKTEDVEKSDEVVESQIITENKLTSDTVIEISSESDGLPAGNVNNINMSSEEIAIVESSTDLTGASPIEELENEESKKVNKNISEEGKDSWVDRWLQRSDSNTVAQKKTSKMIMSVKQKLLTASRKKTDSESEVPQQSEIETVVAGTVDEYKSLPQSTLPAFEAEIQQVAENLTRENNESDSVSLAKVVEETDTICDLKDDAVEVSGQDGVELITEETIEVPIEESKDTDVSAQAVVIPESVKGNETVCSEEMTLEIHYQETEDL